MPTDNTSLVENAAHPNPGSVQARAQARAPGASPGPECAPPLSSSTRRGEPTGKPHTANTRLAYAKDWKHFSTWCRRSGRAAPAPDPQTIALYIEACAIGDASSRPLSRATIERRLCAIAWNAAQRGQTFDRSSPAIARALANLRRQPDLARRREAADAADILAMLGTLPHDLRGLRDRAILLLGFAAGLRRSQIVGLDIGRAAASSRGAVEIDGEGLRLRLREADGWLEATVGRGSGESTCPVAAVERWIRFARLGDGPLFRRIGRDGRTVADARLADKHVARLVRRAALAAGLDADRTREGSAPIFGADALRAGRTFATVAGARRTRLPGSEGADRRGHFLVNFTKALGL
ncbi:integrase [Chelatococcus sp. XZ-Ab1]|uniref:integrase n=1 Tax=Chelatococcus sp. XZ-Ab1 TaxID=3034027 RepID=UPI0023E35E79|nr:integrase [Chelatococcus sp. XZ-Ab1]